MLSADEKRFYQRNLIRQGNYTLQKVASSAGVKNMAEFHNAGYRGLYNGETADDIFKRKKLRYREDILDNMTEDELVAKLFRINQTEQKLLRENISFESKNNEDWFNEIKKLKEVKKIDRLLIEELIEDIVIVENQNIKIIFKCEDKYFEALDFIKRQNYDIILSS